MDRDTTDHFRFAPIQTPFARSLCERYKVTYSLSTAVLVDEEGAHTESTAILRLFKYLGLPWSFLGQAALWCVPQCVRDYGYRLFARNRGTIWKHVRRVTGLDDTRMEQYRPKLLGLPEAGTRLDAGWGLDEHTAKKQKRRKKVKSWGYRSNFQTIPLQNLVPKSS